MYTTSMTQTAQPVNVQFVNVPAGARWQRYPVRLTGLSDHARDYLRRQAQTWRAQGHTHATVTACAQSWACGYRWFADHRTRADVLGASREFVDGWEFAHGEDQYWECMAVDQCQATPGYDPIAW